MPVHRALAGIRGDESRFLAALQDEIEAVLHFLAVLAAAGKIASLHERQPDQRRDAGVVGIPGDASAVGAIALLLAVGEPFQALADGFLLLGGDLIADHLGGQVGDVAGIDDLGRRPPRRRALLNSVGAAGESRGHGEKQSRLEMTDFIECRPVKVLSVAKVARPCLFLYLCITTWRDVFRQNALRTWAGHFNCRIILSASRVRVVISSSTPARPGP